MTFKIVPKFAVTTSTVGPITHVTELVVGFNQSITTDINAPVESLGWMPKIEPHLAGKWSFASNDTLVFHISRYVELQDQPIEHIQQDDKDGIRLSTEYKIICPSAAQSTDVCVACHLSTETVLRELR